MTFRLRHLLAALILHAVLFTVLVTGVQCSQPPTRPPVIQAVLLDPDRKEVAQQKRQDERRKQEEKRRQDDKRKQDEQRRQEEQKRADEARRKLEVQREADAQRRLEAEKKKALDERKKAEEQARRKQEEEERRERDEAVRREAQERALLEEELRREAVAREADREAAQRAETEREKAVALWSEAVQNDVRNAWIRPGGMAEFQCLVRVQQLPDGTVTSAKIVKSCGNPQLDRSVEDAVLRASPLPTISNPAYFLREFAFEFIP